MVCCRDVTLNRYTERRLLGFLSSGDSVDSGLDRSDTSVSWASKCSFEAHVGLMMKQN